jgi:acyl carrier protein phosphodiesterase
LLIINT